MALFCNDFHGSLCIVNLGKKPKRADAIRLFFQSINVQDQSISLSVQQKSMEEVVKLSWFDVTLECGRVPVSENGD